MSTTSDMKPDRKSNTIKLPVTFDVQGGRADSVSTKLLASGILVGVWVFLLVCFILSDMEFISKLLLPVILAIVVVLIIHFIIVRGRYFNSLLKDLEQRDYQFDTNVFWGIYEISETNPYFVRYRNGDKGLFIRFEKDVIVGKSYDVMYDHYEAVSDAYNRLGSTDMRVIHIDYMDNVGNDKRVSGMYKALGSCDNADLKKLMLRVYSNLEYEMSGEYASHDVYLFLSKEKDETFWYNVRQVLGEFMKGNYISYKVLNKKDLKELTMSLLNLDEFSAVDACDSVFTGLKANYVTPIHLIRNGQKTVINKTTDEVIQEKSVLQAEKQVRKGLGRKLFKLFQRKGKKNLDIFDE